MHFLEIVASASGPSGAQWTSIGIVITIVLGIFGAYIQAGQKAQAKSDAETKRTDAAVKPYKETIEQMRVDYAADLKQLREDQAAATATQVRVDDASKEELRRNMAAQLRQRDDVIETRNNRITYLESRVDALEDQLRGKRS